jgi:hypothetical protein
MLISIAIKGVNDPVLTMSAINLCIQQLRGEVDQHQKAKEAKAELKEVRAQQLKYLSAGTKSLDDVLKRRSVVGVIEAHRERNISSQKFKATC